MTVAVHPFELVMADGVVVRGQRWGSGLDWIVLVHDLGEDRDLDDWRPLLPAIMTPERTLLTIDLPGHGASDGEVDASRLASDVERLLEFTKEQGAEWIALAGAGVAATQALEMASSRPVDALVLLSPEMTVEQAKALRGKGESKLFAVGSRAESVNAAVRQARNSSIGWAMLVSLPTDQQGTELLTGSYARQLIERIVAFLAEQRTLARAGLPRTTGMD